MHKQRKDSMTHSPNTEQRERAELCAWLREHSSGAYRQCAEAADLIERLATQAAPASPEPAKRRDVFAICDAYESGMGHGLQLDGHKSGAIFENPEHGKAYEIGYEEGEERARSKKQPAPNSTTSRPAGENVQNQWVTAIAPAFDQQSTTSLRAPASPNTGAVLTPEQCDEFRRYPGTFNQMVQAIHSAGYQTAYAMLQECEAECWRRGAEISRLTATPSPSKGGEANSAAEDNTGKES